MSLRTQRLDWLRSNALPTRTLDPADHDFDDLESMATLVGDARIVQLGEGSHGSGTDFLAKSRLVAFLHQRLGFDVLVWESGMYNCRRVDQAIRSGAPVEEAARQGIFDIWTTTREACSALEYARCTHGTPRPLTIAGFDCQFSGVASRRNFAADLRALSTSAGDTALASRVSHLVDRALEAESQLARVGNAPVRMREALKTECQSQEELRRRLVSWWLEEGRGMAATEKQWVAFDDAVTELSELLTGEGNRARADLAPPDLEFWRVAIGNWRVLGEIAYHKYRWYPLRDEEPDVHPPRAAQTRNWNLRDLRNAEVVQFLADRYYPDRKLILWGHNLHVVNAHVSADWTTLSLDAQPGGLAPLGTHLAARYGADVFTMGFAAYGGMRGRPEPRPLRDHPVPENSLEALCHELGLAHGIVPLRGLKDQDHPMRQPMALAVRDYRCESLDDWTRALDAVMYVDEVSPPTRAGPPTS